MRLYVANEALLMANQANEKKYKKELLGLVEGAMYLITEAAKQGRYSVGFETESTDMQLIQTFTVTLQGMGYAYDNSTISWTTKQK